MFVRKSADTTVTEDRSKYCCCLIVLFNYVSIYFSTVVYSGGGLNHSVHWTDAEERLLSGTIPSEIYKTLGWDFYYTFQLKIKSAYYHFLKQTYGFDNEAIFSSGEMN
jgi:hypothetical protein